VVFALWLEELTHCRISRYRETNIITGLSFTGVCDSNWEEEEEEDDAKLQHYMQFPLKEYNASPEDHDQKSW
jgi:hypothetical protein